MAPACVDPSHVPFTLCRPTPGWLGVKNKQVTYVPPNALRSFVRSFVRSACWLLIALFSAFEQSHCARMRLYMNGWLFMARFWISIEVVYLQHWYSWCHMKLLPSRHVLCTPYNHAPCHFMQSRIWKVHACLAVTCHLHFWQNDRDLLGATAVTRGWNRYRNKSWLMPSCLRRRTGGNRDPRRYGRGKEGKGGN